VVDEKIFNPTEETMSSTIALILVMIWALTRPDARQL
jgi:hypothetical protein